MDETEEFLKRMQGQPAIIPKPVSTPFLTIKKKNKRDETEEFLKRMQGQPTVISTPSITNPATPPTIASTSKRAFAPNLPLFQQPPILGTLPKLFGTRIPEYAARVGVGLGSLVSLPFEIIAKGAQKILPQEAQDAYAIIPKAIALKLLQQGVTGEEEKWQEFEKTQLAPIVKPTFWIDYIRNPEFREQIKNIYAQVPPLSSVSAKNIEDAFNSMQPYEQGLLRQLLFRYPFTFAGATSEMAGGMVETLPSAVAIGALGGLGKAPQIIKRMKEKIKEPPPKVKETGENIESIDELAKAKGLTPEQRLQIYETYTSKLGTEEFQPPTATIWERRKKSLLTKIADKIKENIAGKKPEIIERLSTQYQPIKVPAWAEGMEVKFPPDKAIMDNLTWRLEEYERTKKSRPDLSPDFIFEKLFGKGAGEYLKKKIPPDWDKYPTEQIEEPRRRKGEIPQEPQELAKEPIITEPPKPAEVMPPEKFVEEKPVVEKPMLMPQKGLPKTPAEIIKKTKEKIKGEQIKIGDYRPKELKQKIQELSGDTAWWDGDPIVIRDLAEGFDLKLPKDIDYPTAREKFINHLINKEAIGWAPRERYRRLVKAWQQGDIEAKTGLKLPVYEEIFEEPKISPTEKAKFVQRDIHQALQTGDVKSAYKILKDAKKEMLPIDEDFLLNLIESTVEKEGKQIKEIPPGFDLAEETGAIKLNPETIAKIEKSQLLISDIANRLKEGLKFAGKTSQAIGEVELDAFRGYLKHPQYLDKPVWKRLFWGRKGYEATRDDYSKYVNETLYKDISPEREKIIGQVEEGKLPASELNFAEMQALVKGKIILDTLAEKGGLPKEKMMKDYMMHGIERDVNKIRWAYERLGNTPEKAAELAEAKVAELLRMDERDVLSGKRPSYIFFSGFEKRTDIVSTIESSKEALLRYIDGCLKKIYYEPILKEINPMIERHPYFVQKALTENVKRWIGKKTETDVKWDRALNEINKKMNRFIFDPRFVTRKEVFATKTLTRGILGGDIGTAIANLTGIIFIPVEFGIINTIKGAGKFGLHPIRTYKALKRLREMNEFDPTYRRESPLKYMVTRIYDKITLANMYITEFLNRGLTYCIALEKALKLGLNFEKSENLAFGEAAKIENFPFIEMPKISPAERFAEEKISELQWSYTPESRIWWTQKPGGRILSQFATPTLRLPERLYEGMKESFFKPFKEGFKSEADRAFVMKIVNGFKQTLKEDPVKALRYAGLTVFMLIAYRYLEKELNFSARNIWGWGVFGSFRGLPALVNLFDKYAGNLKNIAGYYSPLAKEVKKGVRTTVKMVSPMGRAIGKYYGYSQVAKRGWKLSEEEIQQAIKEIKRMPKEARGEMTDAEIRAFIKTSRREQILKLLAMDVSIVEKMKAKLRARKAKVQRYKEKPISKMEYLYGK